MSITVNRAYSGTGVPVGAQRVILNEVVIGTYGETAYSFTANVTGTASIYISAFNPDGATNVEIVNENITSRRYYSVNVSFPRTDYYNFEPGSRVYTAYLKSTITVSFADGGWTTRTSNFGTTFIYGLAYANGVYVAAGESGQIRTSTDAITWTTQTSTFGTSHITAVIYGNGTYVAVGQGGTVRTSTDAVTWTTRTATLGSAYFNCVAYGGGKYVAGGVAAGNGQFSVSTDAITWTSSYTGSPDTMRGIAYGQGVFVAGGDSGIIVVSTNGVSWDSRTSNFGGSTIYALTYGDGIFVAGGHNGQLNTSTDTVTWTTRVANFGTSTILALDYASGVFIAAGAAGTLVTSTDGITWTIRTSNFGASNIYALTYGNGLFVAAGGTGQIRTKSQPKALIQIAKLGTV